MPPLTTVSEGCPACHITDGLPLVGLTFKGIFGRTKTVVTAGKGHSIVVDEAYIQKSMMDPMSDVVKAFPPIMPPQKGLVSEDEAKEIITYLNGLK